jgi:hypothetical protein
MSKPTNWILATALLGLPTAAGIAASDEPYPPIEYTEPVPEEPQCDDEKPPALTEQELLAGLIDELQCVFDKEAGGWRWIRLCYTNPAGQD